MSSTNSISTDPNAAGRNPGPSRGNVALVVVTIALLAGLVWVLNPSQPKFAPAPLRPVTPGCPKGPAEFTPSNITEIPDLPLDKLTKQQKYRVLLRLNMEPCPCGCTRSIAACRTNSPTCETSTELANRIVAEEQAVTEPARNK
jgi:hypothetical protein